MPLLAVETNTWQGYVSIRGESREQEPLRCEVTVLDEQRRNLASDIMTRFRDRTFEDEAHAGTRYLWTDAFAVCNFLSLAQAMGEQRYQNLAIDLVDQVHRVLGRHRPDDARRGFISGLGDEEGALHPTAGGLRIGKKLPERGAEDPFDAQAEWDRDGQYFHYLTKWMHALDQVSRVAADIRYHQWARELASRAHKAFVVTTMNGQRRMVWKMSIDLSRPLVSSMGHHDPLDGFITCAELQATATDFSMTRPDPDLNRIQDDYDRMIQGGDWATDDPLGLGGLLSDACRVTQLVSRAMLKDDGLLASLLAASLVGLQHYTAQGEYQQPASRRLAFRELGLAIGLQALGHIEPKVREHRDAYARSADLLALLGALKPYAELGSALGEFWLDPAHQRVSSYQDHRDINEVMLATWLLPDGFVLLHDMGSRAFSGHAIEP